MTQAIIVALISGLLGGGAIAALITVVANRSKVKAEAGSIFVQTANNLIAPLEKRLNVLQHDNEVRDEIIRQQSASYDRLEKKYDAALSELRAIRADRENLLVERVMYQKRTDAQAETIKGLECRVAELERELAVLRGAKRDG
jgi:polyhydroxyalkanoate synthesis regulator phasin